MPRIHLKNAIHKDLNIIILNSCFFLQKKKWVNIFSHSNLNTNWLASFGLYGLNLVFYIWFFLLFNRLNARSGRYAKTNLCKKC